MKNTIADLYKPKFGFLTFLFRYVYMYLNKFKVHAAFEAVFKITKIWETCKQKCLWKY